MKNDIRLKGQLKLYMQWPLIMTILLLAINIWIYTIDKQSGLVMSVFLFIYIGAVVLLYVHNKSMLMTQLVDFAAQYGLVQNELLNDLSIPYAIMLSDGKVVWANDSFAKLFAEDAIMDKYLSTYIQELNRGNFPKAIGEKAELEVAFRGREYRAKLSLIENKKSIAEDGILNLPHGRENFVAVSLTDVTELNHYIRENEDQKLVSGLIYIDNYEEVMESVEEVRQSLLVALIDRKINQYLANCDGLVKIPMKGKITSLNASVSAGIVMYEVVKQRK